MFGTNTNEWHASLHYTTEQVESKTIQWRERDTPVLDVSPAQLRDAFPAKFDDFIAAINQLNGGYAEGDGSYGVVGQDGAWKICGNIYENSDAIQYVELIGKCPAEQLEKFVMLLGCDTDQCIFQNLQGGFFQSTEQFLTMPQE